MTFGFLIFALGVGAAAIAVRGALPGGWVALLGAAVTLAPFGNPYAETALDGEVEIRMLAVAPEARRRGIADSSCPPRWPKPAGSVPRRVGRCPPRPR